MTSDLDLKDAKPLPATSSERIGYTPEAALRYQVRHVGKHNAEMRLVEQAFATIPPPCRVLDVPCGGGRVALWLASQGYTATAADLSEAMLEITRVKSKLNPAPVQVDRQNIQSLTYEDQSFDAAISFRLFHHFPNTELRAGAIAELCRVAKRHVLLSYLSPWAGTSLKRGLEKKLLGRKLTRFPTPLSEVKDYFAKHDFVFVSNHARAPFLHALNIAIFERRR